MPAKFPIARILLHQPKLKRAILIDEDTGRKLARMVPYKEKSFGGKFMKVFIGGLEILEKHKISGTALRIINKLICKARPDNRVPGTREISILLSMKQPAVSRAYKELVRAYYLIRKDRDYYLNPWVYWNGSNALQEEIVKYLDIEFKSPKILKAMEEGVSYEP